jgi:NAD(P)H-flavin reductase
MGPYGASHAEFTSFKAVVLIAGATGVTFTMSVLLDLAHRAAVAVDNGALPNPVRKVTFVWLVRKYFRGTAQGSS